MQDVIARLGFQGRKVLGRHGRAIQRFLQVRGNLGGGLALVGTLPPSIFLGLLDFREAPWPHASLINQFLGEFSVLLGPDRVLPAGSVALEEGRVIALAADGIDPSAAERLGQCLCDSERGWRSRSLLCHYQPNAIAGFFVFVEPSAPSGGIRKNQSILWIHGTYPAPR